MQGSHPIHFTEQVYFWTMLQNFTDTHCATMVTGFMQRRPASIVWIINQGKFPKSQTRKLVTGRLHYYNSCSLKTKHFLPGMKNTGNKIIFVLYFKNEISQDIYSRGKNLLWFHSEDTAFFQQTEYCSSGKKTKKNQESACKIPQWHRNPSDCYMEFYSWI